MKRLLAALALLTMATGVYAQSAYSVQIYQVDSTGSGYNGRWFVPSTSSTSHVLMYDGNIQQPKVGVIGSGLAWDGTTLSASVPTRTQSAQTRSLNTAFQISTTRDTLATYSVQITVTASIAGGQNGDVILEIASDSGFTTNVQTLSIAGLGQTYTLAVALQGVQPQTSVVSGYVPAGYYTRLRTVNNTGTPGFSFRAGQEVSL